MKILIAEDDTISRKILQKTLEKWGYEVLTAADGLEAWDKFRSSDVRSVITDWMMPNLDGIELCRRIRGMDIAGLTYIILLTAKSEKQDLISGMNAGADDFLTKPFDRDELQVRVKAGERVLTLQNKLSSTIQELSEANQRMKADLDAAAQVQRNLLPVSLPQSPKFRAAWAFEPSQLVAGDMFNVFWLDEDQLGLYVLDVSGHGVQAALLAVTLNYMLNPYLGSFTLLRRKIPQPPYHEIIPPAEVAQMLNSRFPMNPKTNQYFTFLYGILDLQNYEFRFVQADHPSPIVSLRGTYPRELEGGGPPIGWFEEAVFAERTISLDPGSRVYLYSDGLTETFNQKREMYAKDRLIQQLHSHRDSPIEETVHAGLNDCLSWAGEKGPADDLTLLGLETGLVSDVK